MELVIKKQGYKTKIKLLQDSSIITYVRAFRKALELEGFTKEGIDKYIPILEEEETINNVN